MIETHVSTRSREPLTAVEDVEPLNEKDQPLFTELYEVLKRHNALQRFGITLLHQRFEMAEDEVLLERTDKVNRRQLIEPVKISALEGKNPIETSWRLDTGKPAMRCVCVVVDRLGRHEHVYWPNGDD